MNDTTVDLLAVSPHPDDVEIGCGATLAKCAKQLDRRVGIAILTRGERGTRGTQAERLQEAESAAERLGASAVEFLDCGDGALRIGETEEDALISLLRRWRPEIVLSPPTKDRHPDHERAARLVRHSCFYAGLRKRGEGEPHRPAAVFQYMLHDPFEPSFVVDVTTAWQYKLEALAEYHSQLHQLGAAGEERSAESELRIPELQASEPQASEPQTKVSSREFREALEGRARHFGQMIGVEFGEPFSSPMPLAIDDLWSLRSRGYR